jgi:hypothetical protein
LRDGSDGALSGTRMQLGAIMATMSVRRVLVSFAAAAAAFSLGAGVATAGPASPSPLSSSVTKRVVPVLGSKNLYPGTYDRGWGTAHPRRIYNGGDASGLISHVRWTHWGATRSHAWGKNAIFKPSGGYYAKRVRIEIRALDLGHCHRGSRLAYTRMKEREPKRPGGPLGRWYEFGIC